MATIEVQDAQKPAGKAVIKVVGVGGAGCNAVNWMMKCGIKNVEFIAINTDAQTLESSNASTIIQLGEAGTGAGAKWEIGRALAEASRAEIRAVLDGADMVFITAGLGKGTGTGASPIVAEIAKSLGALTVSVVTKPFSFEGPKSTKEADEAAKLLESQVDSAITVLNSKLKEVAPHGRLKDHYAMVDDVLKDAVSSIVEIIDTVGYQNVDFNDVKTVMSVRGRALMGSATAEGENRAGKAALSAVQSPLLEGIDLSMARGLLVNITCDEDSIMVDELEVVINHITAQCSSNINPIFGVVYDPKMGDKLRVTVIITGLSEPQSHLSLVEPPDLRREATNDDIPELNDAIKPDAATPNGALGVTPSVPPSATNTLNPQINYDTPPYLRNRADNAAAIPAAPQVSGGVVKSSVPSFLKKQIN